jgi:mRNA interferase HigB
MPGAEAPPPRALAVVQYRDGVLMIRFFGSHEDYDKVDAETV